MKGAEWVDYLSNVVHLIGLIMLVSGLFMLGASCYKFIISRGYKTVYGNIVDFTQEYSTRGFIWKAKIEYEVDEKKYFYNN